MPDSVRRPRFKGYAIFPLGRALEQARSELKLQPQELARLLNLELKEMEALEIGEVPTPEVLQRIDDVLSRRHVALGRVYVEMANAVLASVSGASSSHRCTV